MRTAVLPLRLHTRDRFTIARGGSSEWATVVLEVEEDGLRAWGEGAPRAFYGETVAGCVAAIEGFCARRRSLADTDLAEVAALGERSPAARAAVDTAWHDLQAQRAGVPVHEYLAARHGLVPTGGGWPVSTITIGLDSPERMAAKAAAVADWPALKVKLGSEDDPARLRAVRRAVGAELRVDANAAWTVARTRQMAGVLRECSVALVEQPLPAGDLDGYRALRAHGYPLPVFADESCRIPADLEALAGSVDGVNLKLAKCGGLGACATMILRARMLGLRVMVGCFIESSVAISAAAALSPYVDLLDLDGAALLEHDPYRGAVLCCGRFTLPPGAGLGIVHNERK